MYVKMFFEMILSQVIYSILSFENGCSLIINLFKILFILVVVDVVEIINIIIINVE